MANKEPAKFSNSEKVAYWIGVGMAMQSPDEWSRLMINFPDKKIRDSAMAGYKTACKKDVLSKRFKKYYG